MDLELIENLSDEQVDELYSDVLDVNEQISAKHLCYLRTGDVGIRYFSTYYIVDYANEHGMPIGGLEVGLRSGTASCSGYYCHMWLYGYYTPKGSYNPHARNSSQYLGISLALEDWYAFYIEMDDSFNIDNLADMLYARIPDNFYFGGYSKMNMTDIHNCGIEKSDKYSDIGDLYVDIFVYSSKLNDLIYVYSENSIFTYTLECEQLDFIPMYYYREPDVPNGFFGEAYIHSILYYSVEKDVSFPIPYVHVYHQTSQHRDFGIWFNLYCHR